MPTTNPEVIKKARDVVKRQAEEFRKAIANQVVWKTVDAPKGIEPLPGETSWREFPVLSPSLVMSNQARAFRFVGKSVRPVLAKQAHERKNTNLRLNEYLRISPVHLLGYAFLPPSVYPEAEARLIDPTQPLSAANIRWDTIDLHPWELLKKFSKAFSVSTRGRIRNDETGQEMKINMKSEHPTFSYEEDGVTYKTTVHQLVAQAWVTNPDPTINKVVNHLDGNKRNNNFSNLEWTTDEGNSKHASKMGLLFTRAVVRTDSQGKDVRYPSVKEAALANQVTLACLCAAMSRGPNYIGYAWRYDSPAQKKEDQDLKKGEVFKPVPPIKDEPEFDGLSASNFGRLRNARGLIYAPVTVRGAPRLQIRSKSHSYGLLVAFAWLPPRPAPHAYVVHRDGNTFNNAPSNLEWHVPAGRKRQTPSSGGLVHVDIAPSADGGVQLSITPSVSTPPHEKRTKAQKQPQISTDIPVPPSLSSSSLSSSSS